MISVLLICSITSFGDFSEAVPLSDFSSDTWSVITVPGGADHTYPSAQFGSDQVLHIATFNGTGISYWTFDGNDWTHENVSEEDVWKPCLALDSSDVPYIAAYENSTKNIVLYGKEVSGDWSIEQVYNVGGGNYADEITLQLDPQDHPHIVARIVNESKIVYLHYTGYHWEIKDDFGDYTDIDLALDSSGNPRISYCYDSYLCCTSFYQDQWWNAIIAPVAGGVSSVVVTPEDETAVVGITSVGLSLFQDVGPGWAVMLIDSTEYMQQPDLCIAPDGAMMLAYYDGINADLRYASDAGDGWSWAVIDWEGFTGLCPSVASWGDDLYCVAYCNSQSYSSLLNPYLKIAVFGNETSVVSEGSLLEDQSSFHVLSNPSIGSVSVSFLLPQASETTLSVFSIDGRVVRRRTQQFEAGSNFMTIDGLPSGMYIVSSELAGHSVSELVTVLEN